MKVLLAIDSSPFSDAAIDQVSSRRWPEETEICVLSVVDVTRFGVIGTEGGQWTAALSEAAAESVKAAVNSLKSAGLEAQGRVTLGSPGGEICQYARDWGADFIFVGSHGRGGLTRLLLGSVSRAVIHRAPCSVVVARPQPAHVTDSTKTETTGPSVLIATDGSECSLMAVRSVAQRKWPEGLKISVISVGEMPDDLVNPDRIDPHAIDHMREAANAGALQAATAANGILSGSGFQAATKVRIGDPRSVILDEADALKADLVVLGSHGRRGLDRILLGSVSEAVAAGAHCSVEIIR
ncbi:MAG TPA: universal stress protein [Blastocatellia bacterium]|nr:universal stress protein [Blastocatellia bacterium]